MCGPNLREKHTALTKSMSPGNSPQLSSEPQLLSSAMLGLLRELDESKTAEAAEPG